MVKLLIGNSHIELLREKADLEAAALLSQLPYIHSNRTATEFKTTVRNIDKVLKLFKGIDVHNPSDPFFINGPPRIVATVNKELQRRRDTATLLEQGPTGESDFLYRHQQLGRELAKINDRFAFFYDTRTGKTPMSLQIIADDIAENPDHKWLVLCPLILIQNAWLEDAEIFFPDMSVVNLHASTKKKRMEQFAKKANLYVCNIESFASYQEHVEALGIHGVFVDESSAMKSNSSKFSKAAVDYAYKVKRWYLLSGTPAPNGEYEYFRQLQSIDYYGVHQSYSRFTQYFFTNRSRNPQYTDLAIIPAMKDEMLELLKSYSLYVDKEDVLETPGRDFIEMPMKMPEELQKAYNKMRRELHIETLGRNITAPSEAAKLNKLNQISSGFVIDTDAVFHNSVEESKIVDTVMLSDYRFVALKNLLIRHENDQAIIWCNYKKEFEEIRKILGNNAGYVYGDVNITQKNEAIKAFKEGRVQYLVANPASADKGLTLTNAHIAIYFSMNYSYELFKQSMERIYGSVQKQPKRCKYYIFLAEGTIDEVIYNAVTNKSVSSTAILNHLKGGT